MINEHDDSGSNARATSHRVSRVSGARNRTTLHWPPQIPGSGDFLPRFLPKEAAQRSRDVIPPGYRRKLDRPARACLQPSKLVMRVRFPPPARFPRPRWSAAASLLTRAPGPRRTPCSLLLACGSCHVVHTAQRASTRQLPASGSGAAVCLSVRRVRAEPVEDLLGVRVGRKDRVEDVLDASVAGNDGQPRVQPLVSGG